MKDYDITERVLGRILHEKVAENRNKTFLTFENAEITYGELSDNASRVANGLQRLGVRQGDSVALMLPNCPEYVYTLFALAKMGAISVPVNLSYKGDILEYILNNCDAKVLVVGEQLLERVEHIEPRLKHVKGLVVRSSDEATRGSGMERIPFQKLLDHAPSYPEVGVRHSDTLSIMYTSGTTGPSKGVMVSNCHACTFALDWIRCTGYVSEDTLYTPLPLFHVVASILGVVPVLMSDSKMVIVEKFSASRWWDEMRKYRVTLAHCLTSMMNILLSQPEAPDERNHSVRALYMGGSALSPAIEARFGPTVLEPYGATESGLPLLVPYGEHKPGTCGKENSENFEVKIVDEDDNDLPLGEKGELVIRPRKPYVMMSGYYNMPDATARAFRNLWFHSGDRLYVDADGYFHFVDRMKEVIRRRGENISSYEIERTIDSHPRIVESAAIPVPSELGEDEVKVCIVLKEGCGLDYEELMAYCEENMPYFWIPRYVEFMEALPKTETAKIQKYELRNMGDKGITEKTWDREAAGYRLGKK